MNNDKSREVEYKKEKQAIWDWLQPFLDEYKNKESVLGGLDDSIDNEFKKVTMEFNRKITALNEKYGR